MPSFDRSLPMMLHRTLDVLMPPYRELFAQYDLTEQQWRILRVLWSAERVTSMALSRRTLLAAPSLVRIIDRLERKGLVSRLRSTTDRRVVYIVATKAGRAIEKQVAPEVEAIHLRVRATLSEAEWSTLEYTLDKVRQALPQNGVAGVANV